MSGRGSGCIVDGELPADVEQALGAARGRLRLPRVLFFAETASTNDEASRIASIGAPDGTLVLADAQTAGRGRLGRSWHSPAGAGLYASIVMREWPDASPSSHLGLSPLLTLAGGVALAEALRRSTGLPVELKWPNDLIAGGRRKLGGILTEASSSGGAIQFVIFGFGINLYGPLPPSLASRATTLEAELGRPVERGAILVECLEALTARRGDLRAGRVREVCSRWLELAPSAVGRTVEWTADDRRRRGVTEGIDEAGALLVRVGPAVERIISGEVTWL